MIYAVYEKLFKETASKRRLTIRINNEVSWQYPLARHVEVVPDITENDTVKIMHVQAAQRHDTEDLTNTKLRIVPETCYAKRCNSLNECLKAGPNSNPEILQALFRFIFYPLKNLRTL